MTAIHTVGANPDVLAFDKGLGRLYVSAESGIIPVFDEHDRNVEKVGEGLFAPNAHTVAVDVIRIRALSFGSVLTNRSESGEEFVE